MLSVARPPVRLCFSKRSVALWCHTAHKCIESTNSIRDFIAPSLRRDDTVNTLPIKKKKKGTTLHDLSHQRNTTSPDRATSPPLKRCARGRPFIRIYSHSPEKLRRTGRACQQSYRFPAGTMTTPPPPTLFIFLSKTCVCVCGRGHDAESALRTHTHTSKLNKENNGMIIISQD